MTPVDADVVLVAEGGHGDVDARRTIIGGFRLGELHRPARVAILLRELGRLVLPVCRDAAGPDVGLLAIGVALLGGGHDGGVDDLPPSAALPTMLRIAGTLGCSAHGEEPRLGQRPLIGAEQRRDGGHLPDRPRG